MIKPAFQVNAEITAHNIQFFGQVSRVLFDMRNNLRIRFELFCDLDTAYDQQNLFLL